MGYFSELDIEMQERGDDAKIAEILGISLDELSLLVYDIETDASKEGLVYTNRIEFDIDQSSPAILKKIDRLEDGCRVYFQPYELDNDYYYVEEYDTISTNKRHFEKFTEEIISLKALVAVKLPDEKLEKILNRQIFISVIGTMETFLSEAFINLTLDEDKYFRSFIETHPEFKKRKFELSDIFQENSKLRETAKKVMLDTIYHNLPSVSQMFKDTFNIQFPSIKDVYKYVNLRHDLVHRNGMTKEGKAVNTSDIELGKLIESVSTFVKAVAIELKLTKNYP